jgi:ABC-type phosphate/phosphonate transport system substrate-binding protein
MKRVVSMIVLVCTGLMSGCNEGTAQKGEAIKAVASSPSLRIAIPGLGSTGCQAASTDTAATAYTAHLQKRLEKPVLLCGAKDSAAAAQALKAGDVEMALLDPQSFIAVKDQTRAILAPRFDPTQGRVLTVAMTLKSSGKDNLEKLKSGRPIFIGETPPSRDIPLEALADHGLDTKSFGPQIIATENTGFKALQDGKGDMLIITAGARQRICRAEDPKSGTCPSVFEAWRGRPTAPKALVVSNVMSEADRYQLIGIHIAMHNDNLAALGFISKLMPNAIMLDPTEPSALLKGTR